MLAAIVQYLADTSAFTHIHHPSVDSVLRGLWERGLIAMCGLVELEVLLTARSRRELVESKFFWSRALIRIETEERDFERAADVMELLAARGLHRAVNVNDLLIAAVAERAGLTVLHYDHDFEHIGGVTGQAVEWVVPKGSI